jgi:hypothetical protein
MIGHVHSLANRSDESVSLRRHRVINPPRASAPHARPELLAAGTT